VIIWLAEDFQFGGFFMHPVCPVVISFFSIFSSFEEAAFENFTVPTEAQKNVNTLRTY
jgi:hypothetical protein